MSSNDLLKKADRLWREGDLEQAHALTSESLRVAEAEGDSSHAFNAYIFRAFLCVLRNMLDEAKVDIASASKLLGIVAPSQKSRFFKISAQLASRSSEFDKALEYYQKAMEVWPEIPPEAECGHLINISRKLIDLGDYDRAIETIQMGLDLVHSKPDAFTGKNESLHRSLLETLGFVFVISNQTQEAIDVLTSCLSAPREGWQEVERAHGLQWLAEAYKKLGDFPNASLHIEQSLTIARKFRLQDDVSLCLSRLAEYALGINDPVGAARLAEEALSTPDRPPVPMDEAGIYNIMMVANARNGNAERAAWAYEKSRDYTPSGELRANHHEYAALYFESLGDSASALREIREWKAEELNKISAAGQLKLNLLRIERQKHAAEMLRLRAEKAEDQLALQATSLAAQTELLSHFREELRKIVREIDEPINALRKIKDKLKELPCESIDWMKFEKEFITVHPEFRQKLLEKYPELTKQELKMCQLARLGLKTHEMARLLCLSNRTIDGHRNSLRKKLGVNANENLTKFLKSFA